MCALRRIEGHEGAHGLRRQRIRARRFVSVGDGVGGFMDVSWMCDAG